MANYIHVPDCAPLVPKLDVTVDEHDYRAGALKLIKTLRPRWKPSEVKMKVIPTLSLNAYNLNALSAAKSRHELKKLDSRGLYNAEGQVESSIPELRHQMDPTAPWRATNASCQSNRLAMFYSCKRVFVSFMRQIAL